jgi:methylglutaconyl-CoA hydratase
VDRAVQIGLVHSVKSEEELDGEIDRLVREVLTSAPGAIARAKMLIAEVPRLSPEGAMQRTAETIAALRVADEGQEGLRAFLDKRKPGWTGS